MSCNCKDRDQGKISIKRVGIACLVVGTIQFVIGIVIKGYTTNKAVLGSWWVGLIVMIAGGFGFHMGSTCVEVTALILGYSGFIVGIVAAIFDGVASSLLGTMTSCVNKNGVFFGDSDTFNTALMCQSDYGTDCSCVDVNFSWGEKAPVCVVLDGTLDCDIDLDTLPDLLGAACFISSIAAILSCIFACCVSCFFCCPNESVVAVLAQTEASPPQEAAK